MRCYADMFGGFHLAIYGGGVGVAITAPNGTSVYLQGDDAALFMADYESACADLDDDSTRRGRLGERETAAELCGCYFV